MKTVPLKANQREKTGKGNVKKLRLEKRIPAVVYGDGIKTTAIDVGLDEFLRTIHTKAGENVIIQLTISGLKKLDKTVVIKEIQHNPVTDTIQHVDFNAISLTEKIKVKVPFHVKGESPGVKEGGVLDIVHHEIEVECLPTDIPEKLRPIYRRSKSEIPFTSGKSVFLKMSCRNLGLMKWWLRSMLRRQRKRLQQKKRRLNLN